jgi:hypothetical protein
MPRTLHQTLPGAVQFDGLAGTGQFRFFDYSAIPRTTGIIIHAISYCELQAGGPPLTTRVSIWSLLTFGGVPTTKVTLGGGDAASNLLDADGDARLKVCGHVLERIPGDYNPSNNNGRFWEIRCYTVGKTQPGSFVITYDLCDFQESQLRGSTDR